MPETKNISFSDAHVPNLAAGKYELVINQSLKATGTESVDYQFKEATFNFYVQGERFHIKPQEVHSVFPPAGSLGDHANVLPHIVINRSTLPWERLPVKSKTDKREDLLPWLALLVFRDGELQPQDTPDLGRQAANGFILGLKDIQDLDSSKLTRGEPQEAREISLSSTQTIEVLPGPDLNLEEEIGHDQEDRINLIFVKKALVDQLLPEKAEDLKYRAHTRHDEAISGPDHEKAILIANRLPVSDESSIVHLVSLEHRYDASGKFMYWQQKDNADALIPFISLMSWRFTCLSDKHSFRGHMLSLKEQEITTLRIPRTENKDAELFLEQGFAPLPHRFREGSKSISWYRGPFATGDIEVDANLPAALLASVLKNGNGKATSSPLPLSAGGDQLLQFHSDAGFFDVSYAAAWELGRLLALRNKGFSTQLSQWKKSYRRSQKMEKENDTHAHIPYAGHGKISDISGIRSWIKELLELEGVPFNYLVPDERMLPAESLRFFYLNQNWMASLLDGALSIGGKVNVDLKEVLSGINIYQTGFLMRSSIVSGYPGLHITSGGNDHPPPVRRLLAPNLLLCLFKDDPSQVNFFLQAEVLHFGFLSKDGAGKYQKRFRNAEGVESADPEDIDLLENRVVNFSTLRDKAKERFGTSSITPAQFAVSLIEGTDKFEWMKKLISAPAF